MTRHSALEFIREESRLITDFRKENRNGHCFELRVGNNGTPFILQDMGEHGWSIYFIAEGNNVDKTIEMFCEKTGAIALEK